MDTANNNRQTSNQQSNIITKVYYGEYTLKHWIDLMCKGNIILPEYQRSFVWKEDKVKELVDSLKENLFIPPVTIAHTKDQHGQQQNLIIDGQQRLTSILLAYIGYYPNPSEFYPTEPPLPEGIEDFENQENEEDEEQSHHYKHLDWTFEHLLQHTKAQTPGQIREALNSGETNNDKYKPLNGLPLPNTPNKMEEFFETKTLGFSYIVPEDHTNISTFYSKVFRKMNYYGKTLSALESRRALYYFNPEYSDLFEAKYSGIWIFNKLRLLEQHQPTQIDFVRYLAILSQHHCNLPILRGYSPKAQNREKNQETYCADYISHILNIENISIFQGIKIGEVIPQANRSTRLERLGTFIANTQRLLQQAESDETIRLPSIIDADYYLFGAIYTFIFRGEEIDDNSYQNLISDVKTSINNTKRQTEHTKSVYAIKYTKIRLEQSLEIYQRYIN